MTTSFDLVNDYPVVKPQEYTVTIKGTVDKSGEFVTKTFKFTLLDACDPPQAVTAQPIQDYPFTLADDSLPTYTHSEFSVTPA